MPERRWFYLAGTILLKGFKDHWLSAKPRFLRGINKVKLPMWLSPPLRMHQAEGNNNSSLTYAWLFKVPRALSSTLFYLVRVFVSLGHRVKGKQPGNI